MPWYKIRSNNPNTQFIFRDYIISLTNATKDHDGALFFQKTSRYGAANIHYLYIKDEYVERSREILEKHGADTCQEPMPEDVVLLFSDEYLS